MDQKCNFGTSQPLAEVVFSGVFFFSGEIGYFEDFRERERVIKRC